MRRCVLLLPFALASGRTSLLELTPGVDILRSFQYVSITCPVSTAKSSVEKAQVDTPLTSHDWPRGILPDPLRHHGSRVSPALGPAVTVGAHHLLSLVEWELPSSNDDTNDGKPAVTSDHGSIGAAECVEETWLREHQAYAKVRRHPSSFKTHGLSWLHSWWYSKPPDVIMFHHFRVQEIIRNLRKTSHFGATTTRCSGGKLLPFLRLQ